MARNSMETILNFDNRDRDVQSQWSVVWSTSQIPGMDNATGGGTRRRAAGRRRLRFGSLALAAFLTMHCRVVASVLTGGFFVFILFLTLATALLANPLRHFEVYLGQWSISGPGRAFRIIPMLDGIGIAICINSIIRAICCVCVAAISVIYVSYALSDSKLPFTYCRDFDLKTYDPVLKIVNNLMIRKSRVSLRTGFMGDADYYDYIESTDDQPKFWDNTTNIGDWSFNRRKIKVETCKETYTGQYPALHNTPAYNFFYVEVTHLRLENKDLSFDPLNLNVTLVVSVISVWLVLWAIMIFERIMNGKLIWNNMSPWLGLVPWIWVGVLGFNGLTHLYEMRYKLLRIFHVGSTDIIRCLADALEIALYIHSASTGTELIHGKGLNHYAAGHIDPNLNNENIWHSVLLLLLTGMHAGGSAVCALVDNKHPGNSTELPLRESTLWIIPMYSKCAVNGNYSHLTASLIFGGLTCSYMVVAFLLLKTALHTIFEYRVKLVFIEQIVVAALFIVCILLSLLVTTNGGVALLESVDAVMSGVAMPLVCLLELIGLLYVYQSHDFVSDMDVASEENACSTRVSTQWRIIPFITFITIVMKVIFLWDAEMPSQYLLLALAPLGGVLLAVPVRACHNAYVFLKPRPRRGT